MSSRGYMRCVRYKVTCHMLHVTRYIMHVTCVTARAHCVRGAITCSHESTPRSVRQISFGYIMQDALIDANKINTMPGHGRSARQTLMDRITTKDTGAN